MHQRKFQLDLATGHGKLFFGFWDRWKVLVLTCKMVSCSGHSSQSHPVLPIISSVSLAEEIPACVPPPTWHRRRRGLLSHSTQPVELPDSGDLISPAPHLSTVFYHSLLNLFWQAFGLTVKSCVDLGHLLSEMFI